MGHQITGQLIVLYEPLDIICEVLGTHAERVRFRQVLLVHAAVTEVEGGIATCSPAHVLALHVGGMEHQSSSTVVRSSIKPGRKKLAFHLHLPTEVRRTLLL